MMPILFLMQCHKKFSVIQNTRALASPLGNGGISSFSLRTVRQASNSSQWIDTSDSLNSFNVLREALMVRILKTKRLLGRLWIYGFNRQINLWQKDDMVACRGLIVEGRVELDQTHDPGSIELQTKNVRS